MYVNFQEPSRATDSELIDNDIILRYNANGLAGITILHVSER